MKILTVKDMLKVLLSIKDTIPKNEWENMPIVLGDDEELNGVHEAFFIQDIDTNKSKSYTFKDVNEGKITLEEYSAQSLEKQIKEETNIKGKCILIS